MSDCDTHRAFLGAISKNHIFATVFLLQNRDKDILKAFTDVIFYTKILAKFINKEDGESVGAHMCVVHA